MCKDTIDSAAQSLSSIYFSDIQNGWAVGGNTILKSIDGGINWAKQVNDTLGLLNSVYFVNPSTGYMTGRKNCEWYCWRATIYRTTDAGINWISQLQDTFQVSLSSVYFIDENNGWALGNNLILHTTNGGYNWIKQSSDTLYNEFNTVHFTDLNNGYAVGSAILRTTNGGSDWVLQPTPTFLPLYGVSLTDSITGTIVGMHGAILRTTNGGVTFVEENETNEIATEYYLSNNFPNPFNPTTKIRYSIPYSSKVVIKVFDILGNKIETLVNEEKHTGTYEITWYAENLPSGVYFYQLKAGSFIDTKKMILLK